MDLNMKIVLPNITKQALIEDFEMIEEITWKANIKYRADFRVGAGPDGGYGQSYYIS